MAKTNRKNTKAAAPTTRARIVKSLINIKVPIAHQKISIPAVIVAQSTKAKTKIVNVRKIRIDIEVTIIKAAQVALSTRVGTRIESALTNINTLAHLT